MCGFEAACHKLSHGERIDMLAVTQHDTQFASDYRLLKSLGFGAMRESIRWYLVDRGGRYDFASFLPMLQAAQVEGVQVIWSLFHYGYPDDLDIFSPAFVDRFARYCGAVARVVAENSDVIPFYNPINEISFMAWAGGEAGFIYPGLHGVANEIKFQLIRAAIAGIEAIWQVDPRARIVHGDPMIQVIAPPGRPDLARHAQNHTNAQYEAWDMLGGWDRTELGGDPRYLDILAVNYYHDNQWELERERMPWETRLSSGDPRWLPFHAQLEKLYYRYQRPLFVGETSHFGQGRADWIKMMAQEVGKAIQAGVPVDGMCIYPALDRPDWHDHSRWHHSGLLDLMPDENGMLRRVINEEYCEGLVWAQAHLASLGASKTSTPVFSPAAVPGK
jgi:beta-glucosidase/6-phospho-beta-glucosidase/beta-galactosidase